MGRKIKNAAAPPNHIQWLPKKLALRSEQQAGDHAESKDGNGVFFFHADPGYHAKPQPIARIVAIDGEQGKVGATHPQERFKAVGGHQAAIGKKSRCNQDRHCAERQGISTAAEFTGDQAGHDDRRRGGERGKKPDAA